MASRLLLLAALACCCCRCCSATAEAARRLLLTPARWPPTCCTVRCNQCDGCWCPPLQGSRVSPAAAAAACAACVGVACSSSAAAAAALPARWGMLLLRAFCLKCHPRGVLGCYAAWQSFAAAEPRQPMAAPRCCAKLPIHLASGAPDTAHSGCVRAALATPGDTSRLFSSFPAASPGLRQRRSAGSGARDVLAWPMQLQHQLRALRCVAAAQQQ